MENKKKKNTSKKTIKKNNDKKKEIKKDSKKKKGFTLIELLAVIIILGILMIIAIPSVTRYISDSRKNSYVDTAKEIVSGTRNIVNEGNLGMYDTNTTYYIPAKYINTENSLKSPYGDFTEAYVGVIYDGKGYKYYWISTDDAGQGVKYITYESYLETSDIVSDLTSNEIRNKVENIGIGDRTKIKILNIDTKKWDDYDADENVGEVGQIIVCKKATSLHTKTCEKTNACGETIGNGNTITYGTIPNGDPKAGDAYDCKVTKDGDYTERFYYLRSEDNKAILIHNKNYNNSARYAYDSNNQNWNGPRTAYLNLPSIKEWNNPGIIKPGIRQILSSSGTTSTAGGQIATFDYNDRAARIITLQEIISACGNGNTSSKPYLKNCNYLLENVGFYETLSESTMGYWIETPPAASATNATYVYGRDQCLFVINTSNSTYFGIRPVITILNSSLEK